ncbi:MAG TPA: hypothetical protein P5337_03405 [Aestuariivirga sp.]|nr:hypothetical protein [Aestuariivirga sp.]
MNWFEPLDHYCERLGPGIWAEPLNAVSNAGFIVAAIVLWCQWRRLQHPTVPGLLLVANVFVIGIGSFLFHTFANRWSELADVIPISLFILFYLSVALRAYLHLIWWQSLLAVAAFLIFSQVFTSWFASIIGYTAAYLPALMAIFAVGAAAARKQPAIARGLLTAGLVFTASVMFRAADLPLCGGLPYGTHMVWHLLNAMTLFLLVNLYLNRPVSAVP